MDQTLVLILAIVVMGGFMFWSQWRARKKYQQKMEQMEVGDRVVTIGGIYGELTFVDRDAQRARLKITPEVEIEIGLGAISHQIAPEGEED